MYCSGDVLSVGGKGAGFFPFQEILLNESSVSVSVGASSLWKLFEVDRCVRPDPFLFCAVRTCLQSQV